MNTLSEIDKTKINEILTNGSGLNVFTMLNLMVEMWQWDVNPELPGNSYRYIHPQVKTYLEEKGHSAWLNTQIQKFVFEIINPWFNETYKGFYNHLETQYPGKWSGEYIANFQEFTGAVTDEWMDLIDWNIDYIPAKEEAEDVMKLTDFEK